jgi:pimeloyl-ACP methyl ester carboxylesterase
VPIAQSSAGDIDYLVTGAGAPTTVFVHGLTGSIADTRPFGSGVNGTRAFVHLRGYGASASPDPAAPSAWSYRALADDVRAVADESNATQAFGVSLGASVLLALLSLDPTRFSRLVLALPAALDEPREDFVIDAARSLAAAIERGDSVAIARGLVAMQPESVRARPDVAVWARRRAEDVSRSPLSLALRAVPAESPFRDPAEAVRVLAEVTVPVLVLAQTDDPWHPVGVAERLADALPAGDLVMVDRPLLWAARAQLRATIASFLAG